jgi:hypothetical protein
MKREEKQLYIEYIVLELIYGANYSAFTFFSCLAVSRLPIPEYRISVFNRPIYIVTNQQIYLFVPLLFLRNKSKCIPASNRRRWRETGRRTRIRVESSTTFFWNKGKSVRSRGHSVLTLPGCRRLPYQRCRVSLNYIRVLFSIIIRKYRVAKNVLYP